MKVFGAQLKEFWQNHWPKEYYYDDDGVEVKLTNENGDWILQDREKYETAKLGYLILEDQSKRGIPEVKSFTTAYSAWARGYKRTTLVITVPEDKASDAEEYVRRFLTEQGVTEFRISVTKPG